MRVRLNVLWLCLLLGGCEKPAPAGDREATLAPASPGERRGLRPRGPSPEAPPSPREAMEAADQLETPAAREKALADVAWNAIETDPELAHEAFMRLPTDSPEKIRLIQHYAMKLAEQDAGEAFVWANSFLSEHEAAAAYAQIALVLAETDPRRAASLLSETGVAGREFDVAAVQVIQRWAAQSAPDAAAWVTAFPPGPVREAGIGVVAGKWLPADPSAAFVWLGGLKDAEIRAEAARAMEGVILQQPSEIQKAWLEKTDDGIRAELEEQRDQAMKDVGNNIPTPIPTE